MIKELKNDAIYRKVGGAFKLTALIQRRTVELLQGARPLVETRGMTEMEVAIEEIIQDKIRSAEGHAIGEEDSGDAEN